MYATLVYNVYMYAYVCMYTVESLNEGSFGTIILSFVRRLSSIEKSKMYWNYREKTFWDLKLYPCREIIVLISERPLSEIPLYIHTHRYVYHTYLTIYGHA